jgi:hypothetical protein
MHTSTTKTCCAHTQAEQRKRGFFLKNPISCSTIITTCIACLNYALGCVYCVCVCVSAVFESGWCGSGSGSGRVGGEGIVGLDLNAEKLEGEGGVGHDLCLPAYCFVWCRAIYTCTYCTSSLDCTSSHFHFHKAYKL